MNDIADPLIERVTAWTADPSDSLQGWALREELKRRGDTHSLVATLESKLGPMRSELIPEAIESATRSFNNLLTDLDREEANLEHVRRESRDVFFSVLEALILAEEGGGSEAEQPAAQLFNRVVQELYVFEPAADIAADLQRWGQGETRLSDLLCTGVAGLFDARPRPRHTVEAEVEQFVPFRAFLLQAGAGVVLTPAAFEKQFASNPWWYVKWAAQRLRVAVTAKAHEIRLTVFEADAAGRDTPSRGLDGWEIRLGQTRGFQQAAVRNGAAVLKLPDRIDAASILLQAKGPASGEWSDLFTPSQRSA